MTIGSADNQPKELHRQRSIAELFRPILELAEGIFGCFPWRCSGLIFLSAICALTEGIGFLFVLPALAAIGMSSGNQVEDFGGWVALKLLGAFGLEPGFGPILSLGATVVILHAVLDQRVQVLRAELNSGYVEHLRNSLCRSILDSSWLNLTRHRSSDLLNALTARVDDSGAALHYLWDCLSRLLVLSVYLWIAARLSLTVTLACALCGMLISYRLRKSIVHSSILGKRYSDELARIYAVAHDLLATSKVTKAYGREDSAHRMLAAHTKTLARSVIQAVKATARVRFFSRISAAAALSLVVFASVALLKLQPAAVLLFALIFARIVPQFSAIQEHFQFLLQLIPNFQSIREMEQTCAATFPERIEVARSPASAPPQNYLSRGIEMRGVSFSYSENTATTALTDLSLELAAGKMTVLTGKSGAGKTTLADIVLGLLEPQAGELLFDGDASGIRQWKSRIAYVPQETILTHQSIRENLTWAAEAVSDEALWSALEAVDLVTMLKGLPEGLETIVGDRGMRLSGGERQRIAIARALLTKPAILVLDEATNSIEEELEGRIMQRIKQLSPPVTALVIGHRQSLLKIADAAFEIEAGAVCSREPAVSAL